MPGEERIRDWVEMGDLASWARSSFCSKQPHPKCEEVDDDLASHRWRTARTGRLEP